MVPLTDTLTFREFKYNNHFISKNSSSFIPFQYNIHMHGVIEQKAFDVTAVDTTGAGDTFLGAFIARLDWGDQQQDALRFAAAAAALQVTKQVAANAIPCYETVQNFLKAHP